MISRSIWSVSSILKPLSWGKLLAMVKLSVVRYQVFTYLHHNNDDNYTSISVIKGWKPGKVDPKVIVEPTAVLLVYKFAT